MVGWVHAYAAHNNVFYLFDQHIGNLQHSCIYLLINDDADEAYDIFQSTLLAVFNKHFHIQTKNISSCGKSKPWIASRIL